MSESARPEEAACFEVFRRVMDQAVTPNDHGGRQGALDGVLTYPDGTTAAIEVTSTAAAGRRQLDSMLSSQGHKWPCRCSWRWVISLDDPRDIPRAQSVLQKVIDVCEADGVSRPQQLGYEILQDDEDLLWASQSSVLFHGAPPLGANLDGAGDTFAYVHPGVIGGFVGDEAFEALDGDLCGVLASEPVSRRVQKVANADADERHLMIVIHLTALSFPVVDALIQGSGRPTRSPSCLDPRVTHLWLVPEYGGHVLRWSHDRWSLHEALG